MEVSDLVRLGFMDSSWTRIHLTCCKCIISRPLACKFQRAGSFVWFLSLAYLKHSEQCLVLNKDSDSSVFLTYFVEVKHHQWNGMD